MADRSYYALTWGYDDESDRVFTDEAKAREWAANDEENVTVIEFNPVEGWSRDVTDDWFPEPEEKPEYDWSKDQSHPINMLAWYHGRVL